MTGDRKRTIAELLMLAGLAVAVGALFTNVIHPLLGISGSAAVPARPLLLVGVATWFLRRGGQRWEEFGLRRFTPWWKLLAAVLILFACKVLLFQPLADVLTDYAGAGEPDHSSFAHLHGSIPALVLWLLIAWTCAAFAEEMLFRGFLLGRIASLLGRGASAWIIAAIAQAVLFGLGHAYQGPSGMISTGVTGLGYGLFALACRRNLWPVILVHGLWDTLGLTLLYVRGEASF